MPQRLRAQRTWWFAKRKNARATAAAMSWLIADPISAVTAANAVYTDVWTSMGFEQEETDRDRAFAGYCLNESLYAHATPGALILHCMPMIRDKEIAASLVDHECSALFRQSENRMHAQKALLIGLMAK